MRFSKKTHKVNIKTLNDVEAGVFLNFLLLERYRHQTTVEMCDAWIGFWDSEAIRQTEEIEKIDERIKQVKGENEILKEKLRCR